MSGPRTAKDALLAERLGDMDQLLTRFDQSQKSMEELRASIQRSHEAKAGQAARELEAATVKFGEVTTRSVDDFVSVANEALSKFMQRTNEIKGLLDNLAAKPSQAATVAAPAPTKTSPRGNLLWWLLPLVFGVGVSLGVGMAFAVLK